MIIVEAPELHEGGGGCVAEGEGDDGEGLEGGLSISAAQRKVRTTTIFSIPAKNVELKYYSHPFLAGSIFQRIIHKAQTIIGNII